MRNHDPCKSILPRLMMVGAFALLLSACGGGGGGGDGGEVDNPTPVADGITPSEVRAKGSGTGFTAQAVAPGGSDLTLMVTGSDFVEGAVVRWNGQARETTFGSASELTATIWAADLAVPGEAYVTVFNPEPAGGESAALEFTITNPLPVSDTTSPNAAFAGGAGFGLTVTGRDFVEGAAVRWNGADQATTYISSSELSAAIDATAIATAGAANVSVSNPGPGGGESGLLTFAINNPPPSIAELLPNISPQGGASFFLTVNGTGFVWNSVVRWNGQIRATTFIDASRLTAVINATDIASAGVATVDVVSPAPGGGTSNAQIVTISDTAPTTTGIMPGNAVAGGGQFDLTVDGTNFNIGSVVRWNGANRTTTYVSATELRATIDAADIASAGTAIVSVERPGSGVSNPQFFTIANPQPVGGALVPASMVRDSGGFTLIVQGGDFVAGSIVRWNNTDRLTVFVSDSQINATITATDIAQSGTAAVTVFNPGPGGGETAALTFTIDNPVPTIAANGLTPDTRLVGSGTFILAVTGSDFTSGAVVNWNGLPRATAFSSASQLTASIDANDVDSAGPNVVTVTNPLPGGGESNGATFTVTNPVPMVGTLLPNAATAGGANLTLTVNGANFVNGSTVRWNGGNRATTFVSNSQLTATIEAADMALAGTGNVDVLNPTPGGGPSNMATFAIDNPLPVPIGLTPDNVVAGSVAFTLTVNGSGFVDGAVVNWNGSPRNTTFLTATQLSAAIGMGDVATAGTAMITVTNPSPGGGTSTTPLTFTINSPNPLPATTNLMPNTLPAGSGAFTLTVNGSNFVSTAVVNWNGGSRATTFVDATRLTAAIPATDLAVVGPALVTVTNPAPGGGTSTPALTFTVNNDNPQPTITGFSPPVAIAGSGGFTLIVDGTSFVNGATVLWNGISRATTFVSSTRLTAAIAAGDIAAVGSADISVRNPPPAVADSAALGFAIVAPGFALIDISPRDVLVGAGSVALNVIGTGFAANSVVRVNGVELTTGFVDSTLLTANAPASVTGTAGTAVVVVENPGTGFSNTETFFVLTPDQEYFYDGFARANGPIGNNWTEKFDDQENWAINNNAMVGPQGFLTYHDKVVYRPPAEDRRDLELSMEFTRRAPTGDGGFAQIHARIQRDTVDQEVTLQSYIFYVDDFEPAAASIAVNAPIAEALDCNLIMIPFPNALVTGNRYRLRFNVSGAGTVADPVLLVGSVDELDANGAWVLFATGQTTHDPNTPVDPALFCTSDPPPAMPPAPIDQPGAMGFSKWLEPTEILDNYYWIGSTTAP